MSEQLKPCPFCEWKGEQNKLGFARCANQFCFMHQQRGLTPSSWNTRAGDELIRELVAALEALSSLEIGQHSLIARLQFSTAGREISAKVDAAFKSAKEAGYAN